MTTLGELLTQRSPDIVASFVAEVRRTNVDAKSLPRTALVDHIPVMLAEVALELRGQVAAGSARHIDRGKTAAREHGRQRWNLGYDLKSLVEEYGVLRNVIVAHVEAHEIAISAREFDVLGKALNTAIAEATEEYIRYRDTELQEQQANLEFLAAAGEALSSSLDYQSTLAKLTGLLVPRLADWCVVRLDGVPVEDIPIVHVDPAKRELLREIYRSHSPSNESFMDDASVMRTGSTRLTAVVESDNLEVIAQGPAHLALLRQLDTCSSLIVSLRVQQHAFGTLTLGYSESRRHYGESDLVLVTDLVRRAAVAIDNAHLYQLSQLERSRFESATRAKDEFVAMVSHELRTPLNAILGWTRLIRSGTLTASKKEQAFEVIERNAVAQDRLVNDLLDISRAITGKVKLYPSQVDLANIVDVALEDVRLALDAKRLHLDATIERGHALMRGDSDRLQQIFWNLLTNAIKFTPKGGALHIELRRAESELQLIVRDTGVGIAKEFLPHVFDPFRQSDSSTSRAHGGLGIGLSITKHLVDLHGGSIEAQSPGPGQGATFIVRLPISPLLTTTLGVAQVPATRREPTPYKPADLHNLRILVVDDEADARELIGYLLETCGATVRQADSATSALAALQIERYDLVISDIGMPDDDGYALIRAIRTLGSDMNRAVPAIALTAFARNEDRERALTAGFNLHIAKPVEPSSLVQAALNLVAHGRGVNSADQ